MENLGDKRFKCIITKGRPKPICKHMNILEWIKKYEKNDHEVIMNPTKILLSKKHQYQDYI